MDNIDAFKNTKITKKDFKAIHKAKKSIIKGWETPDFLDGFKLAKFIYCENR